MIIAISSFNGICEYIYSNKYLLFTTFKFKDEKITL